MADQQMWNNNHEINVFDLLIVFLKRKKIILFVTFAFGLTAVIVSLIMSPVYQGTSRIMPPAQTNSSFSQLLGELSGFAGLLGVGMDNTSPSDLYIGLLATPPILDSIVEQYHLMESYRAETKQAARAVLAERLTAVADPASGIITLGVEDEDPERAADMANSFVDGLKEMLGNLAVTEAAQRRLFFEGQLKEAQGALVQAEEELLSFMEVSGAIRIDEQSRVVLQGIAALSAQIAEREVQLRVMRTYASKSNPDLMRVEESLRGLREQLKKLEANTDGSLASPVIASDQIPRLGTEYIRKMRDYKYQEALYEILVKQYEAARLDEAKNAAIVQVIHKAAPPELPVRPRRTLIVFLATAIGFVLSIFAALFMEFVVKASQEPENRERFAALRTYAKRF